MFVLFSPNPLLLVACIYFLLSRVGVSQYTNVTLVWSTYTTDLEDSSGELLLNIALVYGSIVMVFLSLKTLFWKLEGTPGDDRHDDKKNMLKVRISEINQKQSNGPPSSISSPRIHAHVQQQTSPRRDITQDHHNIATCIKQYLHKNYLDRIFVGVFSNLSLGMSVMLNHTIHIYDDTDECHLKYSLFTHSFIHTHI